MANFLLRSFGRFLGAALSVAGLTAPAVAGPVFLTGHDPDFHAQGSAGAQDLLRAGLSFATGGTYNTPGHKFLWVESNLPVIGGHLFGENGLIAIGLTPGVNFDQVNAAGLAGVNFSNYSAIGIASDFGGMLTSAEIDALIARSADIKSFINGGGGLFAAAECGVGFSNCDSSLVTPSTKLYGFLPVTVTSTATTAPYSVTPFGASLGLNNGDVNDPTHNSFAAIGGLNIVDNDSAGVPTTLAGVVSVGDIFLPVPEPTSLALLASGLIGLGYGRRKRA